MTGRRLTLLFAVIVLVAVGTSSSLGATPARAALTCAQTATAGAPASPSPGHPCWVDVTPYPFGSDGNPVDPASPPATCNVPDPADNPFGPNWQGDLKASPNIGANIPCYLDVTSMAFRAWNRGLAATKFSNNGEAVSGPNAFGIWLYNGSDWYPDPTFPGASQCPGSTVLWAGKLDYWLIGSVGTPTTTLCRFDGVNLIWEPLKLPAATTARLGGASGVTSGACYAWNNCWFFGSSGIIVHWDGQSLVDASANLGDDTYQVNFAAAVDGTDASGNPFGVALDAPLASGQPNAFASTGGAYYPTSYTPPVSGATGATGDTAMPTTLQLAGADANGDIWTAGTTGTLSSAGAGPSQPTPLLRLTEGATAAACPNYGTDGADTLHGIDWGSLAVFPDGDALAGVSTNADGAELLNAACGAPATMTEFVGPNPLVSANQTPPPPLINALQGGISAVAATASNAAWAASSGGQIAFSQGIFETTVYTRPHLYEFTDGQIPDAPPGDDSEPRSALLTPALPVYVPAPPSFTPIPQATAPPVVPKTKVIKLKPAVYDVTSEVPRLSHAAAARGLVTLYIDFKVRRAVTIGVDALHGGTVVASSGMHHFRRGRGRLTLHLNRRHWPNHLKFVEPKKGKAGDA